MGRPVGHMNEEALDVVSRFVREIDTEETKRLAGGNTEWLLRPYVFDLRYIQTARPTRDRVFGKQRLRLRVVGTDSRKPLFGLDSPLFRSIADRDRDIEAIASRIFANRNLKRHSQGRGVNL